MTNASSAAYFLGLLAQVAIRVPHERRRSRTHMEVDRADVLELTLLGMLPAGLLLVPTIYALTPWLDRADYRLSPVAERRAGGLGAIFLVLSLLLFWRSHADLGRNWSPSLQLREEHQLVTRGVYRHVRHPMYASEFLWIVAQALLLRNWIAGPAGAASFLPLYALRVPREERMMLERFEEEYRAYMGRAGRVFPRLGRGSD
ncbi:MAG TPA: protein-S-isoprenylcysteine O-methyltransferase [Rubrobacter sp.]|nr:protein-S-isoprenylcysteine O-methyltransferase [Rubrobacter sp.]